jgi:predicted transcriptional regulator
MDILKFLSSMKVPVVRMSIAYASRSGFQTVDERLSFLSERGLVKSDDDMKFYSITEKGRIAAEAWDSFQIAMGEVPAGVQ